MTKNFNFNINNISIPILLNTTSNKNTITPSIKNTVTSSIQNTVIPSNNQETIQNIFNYNNMNFKKKSGCGCGG